MEPLLGIAQSAPNSHQIYYAICHDDNCVNKDIVGPREDLAELLEDCSEYDHVLVCIQHKHYKQGLVEAEL